MRILHISDFHLDKKDKEDNVNHIVQPLINRIQRVIIKKPIDLIFFTGDLVNIGGKNYSGLDEEFLDFEETQRGQIFLVIFLFQASNFLNQNYILHHL